MSDGPTCESIANDALGAAIAQWTIDTANCTTNQCIIDKATAFLLTVQQIAKDYAQCVANRKAGAEVELDLSGITTCTES